MQNCPFFSKEAEFIMAGVKEDTNIKLETLLKCMEVMQDKIDKLTIQQKQ